MSTLSVIDLARTKSTKELEKIAKRREVKIEKKEKELDRLDETILNIKDKVAKSSVTLQKKREHEKAIRVATSRILSHTKAISMDSSKRPSDRTYEIRAYSKMDMDVWRYNQVRDWFNSYATEQEPYRFSPSETGYTLRIDDAK